MYRWVNISLTLGVGSWCPTLCLGPLSINKVKNYILNGLLCKCFTMYICLNIVTLFSTNTVTRPVANDWTISNHTYVLVVIFCLALAPNENKS